MTVLADYPQLRKAIYATYALIGIAVGVLHLVFASNPQWLDVTTQVVAYLGVALGVTAHVNVKDPYH